MVVIEIRLLIKWSRFQVARWYDFVIEWQKKPYIVKLNASYSQRENKNEMKNKTEMQSKHFTDRLW